MRALGEEMRCDVVVSETPQGDDPPSWVCRHEVAVWIRTGVMPEERPTETIDARGMS